MANKRGLVTLFLVTGLVLGLAIAASLSRRDASAPAPRGDEPLFPRLAASPNDAARLVITRAGETFTIEREGDAWRLAEMGGYPARFDKVRETLLGLAEYRLVEPKTSRPDSYARLKVEDVTLEGAQSTLVRVLDARGQALGAALFGDRVGSLQRGVAPSVYVRREGEAQSWRAQGNLYLDVTRLNWVEREIVRLTRERPSEATIAHADGEVLRVRRDSPAQPAFDLLDVPEGKTPASPAVGDSIGQALAHLGFDDARRADQLPLADHKVATTTFRTFDGLVITLDLHEIDGQSWATAAFSADDALLAARGEGREPAAEGEEAAAADPAGLVAPDKVREEIASLSARSAGWAYQLPRFKADVLLRRMKDMVNETRGAEDAPPAEGGAEQADVDATNFSAMIEALESSGAAMPASTDATGEAPAGEAAVGEAADPAPPAAEPAATGAPEDPAPGQPAPADESPAPAAAEEPAPSPTPTPAAP